jgi:hypothetical protein
MTTTMMAAATVEIARDFLSRANFIPFSSGSLTVLKHAHAGFVCVSPTRKSSRLFTAQTLSGWDVLTDTANAWQIALTASDDFTVSLVTSIQRIS